MSQWAGSLDANILLRLILKDLPNQHAAAVEILQGAEAPLYVATTALVETVFVLERHYKLQRPQISEAVAGILEILRLYCDRALMRRALNRFVKYSALSFADCCLVTEAELEDAIPLWTFDKKLAKQLKHTKLVPAAS